jgi:hypothetical protein
LESFGLSLRIALSVVGWLGFEVSALVADRITAQVLTTVNILIHVIHRLRLRLRHSALRCLDDIVELINDRLVDILCLQETWHDADSPVLGRLRCSGGFTVVDAPQPRLQSTINTMGINHGGVAVIAASSGQLLPAPMAGLYVSTFELVVVRTSANDRWVLLAVVYRPGSVHPSTTFVDERSSLLERLAVAGETVFLVDEMARI